MVSNVGCDDHTVNAFDTFFDSVAEDTLRVIASIVFSSAPRMMKIGKQVNLSDCGVLSIAIAYEICTGQDPSTVIFNHRQIRQHLATCLETYKLSPFPRQVRKRQGGVKRLIEVELHCVCRMPHSDHYSWAQCNVWFHKECMDIPTKVFSEAGEVEWVCKLCQ